MSSYEYDEACIQAFLEQQLKLFPGGGKPRHRRRQKPS